MCVFFFFLGLPLLVDAQRGRARPVAPRPAASRRTDGRRGRGGVPPRPYRRGEVRGRVRGGEDQRVVRAGRREWATGRTAAATVSVKLYVGALEWHGLGAAQLCTAEEGRREERWRVLGTG